MTDLASKVLFHDHIPRGRLAIYLLPNHQNVAYTYHNNKIVSVTQADEILIPMIDEEINFDEVLIQLLNHSVDGDPNRNITAGYSSNKWYSYLQSLAFIPTQVIMHPSCSISMPLMKKYTSELCPKETAYFLPAPELLGVYATREVPDAGISILYPHRVVKVSR